MKVRLIDMLKFTRTKKVTKSYQIRDIPEGIWKKYKIKCMEDNVPTLQDGILSLVDLYVKGKVKLD